MQAAAVKIPRSAYFALFVLVLANLFNMLDRSILSILAQSIKKDLRLDDADLGFLLGTAFAVFYSVVGIAMGRISDFVSRKRMLAVGLALWSVMTAIGGASFNFVSLSFARIGVGVGEAVANPCSHSLLTDVFPPRRRALALGTYLTGTFFGSALAMVIGGYFVAHWHDFCHSVPLVSACALPGWKATMVTVGVPGLLLALLVLTLHEPARTHRHKHGVARLILMEIGSALPPFTLITLYRMAGRTETLRNLALALGIAGVSALLSWITGDVAQWGACGFGAYSIATWGQVQSHGDKPLYKLTYGDPTFALCIASTALVACVSAAFGAWAAPLAMRTFTTVSAVKIGIGLGAIYMSGSIVGVVVGGWLTDLWKSKDLRAPLGMTAIALTGMIPFITIVVYAKTIQIFFIGYFLQSIVTAIWSGGIAAMIQDLVLPRMRGAAAACHSLVAIVVSAGIGPYWAGKVSKMTGSLSTGILSILVLAPIAYAILWIGAKQLRHETPAKRLMRAAAAGEMIE